MTSPLMISVAGVRGIVGESLTPAVLTEFAGAFASGLGDGPVVIGRDARRSGPMVLRAVTAGVMAAGHDVVDLGLATTPATQIAVEHLRAAGGIILTASHNPPEWNALKFLSARGEFLSASDGASVRERAESRTQSWRRFDALGSERAETHALEWHLERVLSLDVIDLAAIRARHLSVAVDGCASVGGVAVPRLLESLGARVFELDCVPNGAFTRELEPLPENLGALGRLVRERGADFGVALDPDADRAAFVDHLGVPLGEEFTVALGTSVVLEKHTGPVVTNLSTSRILNAVCARSGVPLYRTAVGEAHVVAGLRSRSAVAGGEGNGGMIVPAAHYGRDGLVAVALVANLLATHGGTLRDAANLLPRLYMIKARWKRQGGDWAAGAGRLREAFADMTIDDTDGLHFSRNDAWVHVRASGTEPVVRAIAETPDEQLTRSLVERAGRALGVAV